MHCEAESARSSYPCNDSIGVGNGLCFFKRRNKSFSANIAHGVSLFSNCICDCLVRKDPKRKLKANFQNCYGRCRYSIQSDLTVLKGLEAGRASLIVQLEVPFLVILGARFLHEKPGWRKWIGIAISFGGVALMTQQQELIGSALSLILVITGCCSWAVGQVMVRKLENVAGMQVTAWVAVFAAPQLFIMSVIFEHGQLDAHKTAEPLV